MEAVYFASTQHSMLQTRTRVCAFENTAIDHLFFNSSERPVANGIVKLPRDLGLQERGVALTAAAERQFVGLCHRRRHLLDNRQVATQLARLQ
jgi:hypothetical protein